MTFADRKYIPHTIAIALAGAVGAAAVAPAEAKLGQTVKLIYLHASVTWIALLTFAAAALLGLVAIVRHSDAVGRWSVATLCTATLLWLVHFGLGLVVMKLAWGGWFWSEPRVRAGMLILGTSIAASLVATSVRPRWAGPALAIGTLVFVVLLLATIGRVFHPAGAIRSSNSIAIKGAVASILVLIAATSVQTARLFGKIAPASE